MPYCSLNSYIYAATFILKLCSPQKMTSDTSHHTCLSIKPYCLELVSLSFEILFHLYLILALIP